MRRGTKGAGATAKLTEKGLLRPSFVPVAGAFAGQVLAQPGVIAQLPDRCRQTPQSGFVSLW